MVKASGVGFADDALLRAVMAAAPADALAHLVGRRCAGDAGRDRAATRRIRCARALPELDLVLTYGGGDPVVDGLSRARRRAIACRSTTRSIPTPTIRWRPNAALPPIWPFSATACRTARRASRSSSCAPAERLPAQRFLLGGAGWDDKPPARPTSPARPCRRPSDHNAFNARRAPCSTSTAPAWPSNGFSPPTRVFEAAGAGACLDHRCLGGHRACSSRPARRCWWRATARTSSSILSGADAASGPPRSAGRRGGACWPSTPMTGAPPRCIACCATRWRRGARRRAA